MRRVLSFWYHGQWIPLMRLPCTFDVQKFRICLISYIVCFRISLRVSTYVVHVRGAWADARAAHAAAHTQIHIHTLFVFDVAAPLFFLRHARAQSYIYLSTQRHPHHARAAAAPAATRSGGTTRPGCCRKELQQLRATRRLAPTGPEAAVRAPGGRRCGMHACGPALSAPSAFLRSRRLDPLSL